MIFRRTDAEMRRVEEQAEEQGEDIKEAKLKARLSDLLRGNKLTRFQAKLIVDDIMKDNNSANIIGELEFAIKEYKTNIRET